MKNFNLIIRHILPSVQIRQLAVAATVYVLALLLPGRLFAQAPAISYSTSPGTGITITPLSPVNTGGAVGSFGFGTPTLFTTGVTDPVCMAMDKSGNMYIGESSGKVSLLPAGGSTATVFATGFGPVNGIALDASNNVYLADGTSVWKIPAGGGTAVTVNSFGNPVAVAIDAAGTICVADNGAPAFPRIYRMQADGAGKTAIAFGQKMNSIAADSDGNLYFPFGAELWDAVPGGQSFVAHISSSAAYFATDATGNIYIGSDTGIACYAPGTGSFTVSAASAKAMVVDASNNVYYTDGSNIYKLSPVGGYFISPQLSTGLAINSSTGVISGTRAGEASAVDYHITAFNASGSSTATITINPVLPTLSYSSPQSYQVGTAISALSPSSARVASVSYSAGTTVVSSGLGAPVDVAADAAGNLYAAEFNNNQVVKIPAGGGAAVVLGSGFSSPLGVAVDAAGNVYVADAGNNAVKEIMAGSGAVNTIGSGFSGPTAVAVDGTGNVYVADNGHSALKKVLAGGATTVTLQSGFASMQGVAVDPAGNIYVADAGVSTSGNGAVYKIPVGGGSMVSVGTGFARPTAVAADAGGNLYVADINKSVITVVEPGGAQFTAGSGLNHANGVTFDTTGNLYITDAGTASIKEVKITGGYFLSAFLPAGLSFDNTTGIISGTPSAPSPTANYTITGWNITGSAAATVSITVGVPIISYTSPVAYATGAAITPLTPSVAGGAVAPAGFSTTATPVSTGLNDVTCVAVGPNGSLYMGEASGKVSVLAPGSSLATVYATGFADHTGFTPREGIVADAAGNVYFADEASVWKIPAGGGAPVTLGNFKGPSGIALDGAGYIYVADGSGNNNGVFKMMADGTGQTRVSNVSVPTLLAADKNGNLFFNSYLFGDFDELPAGGTLKTLFRGVGATAATTDASGNCYIVGDDNQLYLLPAGGGKIQAGPVVSGVTGLSFDANLNLYIAGGANESSSNVIKTAPIGGYFISPELPDGLTINPNTGVISGTPTTASPATNYTVKAFNAEGSTTATVNITVGPAPVISYSTPQIFTVGAAITPLPPSTTGAAVGTPGFNATTSALTTGITDATCMAMDKNGTLYIGESSGQVSVFAAGSFAATVLATGFNTNTSTSTTAGIAVDAPGNVYFADGSSVWKIPAGGGTSVKLSTFSNPSQVCIDSGGALYVRDSQQGIYKMAADGSNKTQIVNGFTSIMTVDQNGNLFFSRRGSLTGLFEVPAGGTSKVIIPPTTFRGFATDPSGNVYMINADLSIGMVPAGGTAEATVEPVINGLSSIMIGPDFNLYAVVSGSIVKINPTGGYFISPELPDGLTIDPTSGAISGTPTAVSSATNYTVTAFSNSVKATAPLNISVVSSNANLSNLTVNSGTLSPAFAVGTTNYTDTVSSATASVILTPTAADANATIKVNGVTVASGTPASVALSATTNIIPVVVTAQDGTTTKTYTLTVNRPSNNIKLSTFKVTPSAVLTIVPGPHYRDYEAIVYAPTSSIQVTAITQDATAAFTVNGMAVTSGVASAPIPLNTDTTTIYTTITAGDGVTRKTYAMKVTRLSSNNAKLTSFKLSPSAALTAVAGTDYRDYTATVRSATSSISILAISQDATATITVNGMPAISGTVSSPIHLNLDTNTIYTTVTAADGVSKKTYAIVVTRPPSNNAVLATFTTTPKAALTAVPGTDYRDYEATIFNPTSSISIIAAPQDAMATFTVNGLPGTSGTASAPINLNADTTTIYTTVMAGDGVTKKTYALKVTRQASNNAVLTTFTTTPKTALTAVQGTDYRDYLAIVSNSTSSISIFAVTQDATATITVNGVPATSGTASDPVHLNVDSNTIYTTVTAGDGVTKKTYAILITRAAPPGLVMKYEAPAETLVTGGEIVVHQNVSPNGDGRSDGLVIEGIAAHPDNRLQIMSRSGVLVYEAKGYDNATKVFDGHASTSGKLQQAGTYFYSLEYKVGKEIKHKTGFIVLKY